MARGRGYCRTCPILEHTILRAAFAVVRIDDVADAEIGHVRDSFGTVIVAEFRGGFLAGVHARDAGAAGVMGRPLGDVVDLPGDDDPAVVPGVVQGDLLARDAACPRGGNGRRPELAGDLGVAGLGGPAEVPGSPSLGR